jgi:uncharacterized protein
MEHKLVSTLDLKAVDAGNGEVQGYASTFGNFDDVGERVVKGAFSQHLTRFLSDGFISVGHDWQRLPIATPVEAFEDDHGLFVRAAFHSTPDAQAARTVIKERIDRGKSVKLSIGYEVLQDEYTQEGRLLKDVRLFEWSYVTVPANPLAGVTGAKGNPLAGLPFAEHSQSVLAAVQEFRDRATDIHRLRAKEGRVLSDANRKRIQALKESLATVLEDLDELLSATEPKDNGKAVQALYTEFLRLEATLNGAQA